jgi:hypothetical protein
VSEDAESEEEETNPVRRTLDLLIFAPVGVALTVVEDLPALIAKGRQRMETQIRNARVVGQFVVDQGQKDLTQKVGRLLHGSVTSSAADQSAEEGHVAATAATAPAPPPAPPPAPKPTPDPADGALVERALAGYDTLSASQVVRRLESLGPDELRAVHRHEASHRNRRTILNRTQQLLDGAPAGGTAAAAPPSDPPGE